MGKKHPNVTNINEVEPRIVEKGTKFGFHSKRLGAASGSRELGCMWMEVAPGKTAIPNHYHCAMEEAVYILEGNAEARIGKDTVTVGAGDYIAYPTGPEYSHSLKNTGTKPLRYLCFSTMEPTDVVGYPDSKKFMAVGCVDNGNWAGAKVRFIIKDQPSVDYYEGEAVD